MRSEVSFWSDGNILNLTVVVVAQACEYAKATGDLCFQWASWMVGMYACELHHPEAGVYFSKGIFIQKEKKIKWLVLSHLFLAMFKD